jgi:hypothetical protein
MTPAARATIDAVIAEYLPGHTITELATRGCADHPDDRVEVIRIRRVVPRGTAVDAQVDMVSDHGIRVVIDTVEEE